MMNPKLYVLEWGKAIGAKVATGTPLISLRPEPQNYVELCPFGIFLKVLAIILLSSIIFRE